MVQNSEKSWHALEIGRCIRLLSTSEVGLSQKEAAKRQKTAGKNRLLAKKDYGRLAILISQFRSPMVYILLAAAAVSFLLGHNTDAGVILTAVVINAVFGFWQEYKADRALKQLKKIVRQKARVVREGRIMEIDAEELVPGDIILVKSGDRIPADARIISAENLALIEANLTGEPEPSLKSQLVLDEDTALGDRKNMLYMGTVVAGGRGKALVCFIGENTEIGKINKLVRETREEETPLQRQLRQFGRVLSLAILFLCALIFLVGLINKIEPVEIFVMAVALAVAAIPEGLVMAITIILTIGMQFILRRKALVRKLLAAETLGSVSVICTDKTGTLTEGEMRVFKILTADKEYAIDSKTKAARKEKNHDLIAKISVLCSNAVIENPNEELEKMRIIGDPTEKALLIAAMESGFSKEELDQEYPKLGDLPFDSEKKYMASLHQHAGAGHQHIFVKGAPEIVLGFCDQVLFDQGKRKLDKQTLRDLSSKYEKLTGKGLRLLAVAYKTGDRFQQLEDELNGLVFLGFVALKDPLRPEAKEAIGLCRLAGIRPVMVTGDHRLTARAIFEELGVKGDHNIVEGRDLDSWSDEELSEKVKDIDIYARVEPQHKLRIVNAWKARGEVVAMTGDGVNDAPALKAADIGIALGDGADVTKETADIVLLDNNFKVIVAAVEQGRIIFDNIRKVILYLLSDSFSEIILVSASVFFGLPMPILATQILWINLVNDGLPNVAMTMEKGERGVMNRPPIDRKEPILNNQMKAIIFIIGLVTDLMLLALFVFLLGASDNIDYIRTVMFVVLGCDSLLYAFSVRGLHHSIFTRNPFSNKILLWSVAVSFIMLLLAVYLPWLQQVFKTVPLGYQEWFLAIGMAFIGIILIEAVKHYFIIQEDKRIKPA